MCSGNPEQKTRANICQLLTSRIQESTNLIDVSPRVRSELPQLISSFTHVHRNGMSDFGGGVRWVSLICKKMDD
jgi:hypothetical protein